MVISKSLLVTRPNHDPTTDYLCQWSTVIIDIARKKGFKVYDLKGDKATRKMFESYLKARKPTFLFLNGHGDARRVTGYENESLLEYTKNERVVKNSIIYARSCDAGRILGPELVKIGARVFIGYNRKFIIGYTPRKITRPLEDEIAKLFLEPSNLVPSTILKGHTAFEADDRSKAAMYRNFRRMISSSATYKEQYAAKWLWGNFKAQVLYGDPCAGILN